MKLLLIFAAIALSTSAQAVTIETDDLCYTKDGVIGYVMRPDDPFRDATCSPVGVGEGCITDGGLCQSTSGKLGTCVEVGNWPSERHYCSEFSTLK